MKIKKKARLGKALLGRGKSIIRINIFLIEQKLKFLKHKIAQIQLYKMVNYYHQFD